MEFVMDNIVWFIAGGLILVMTIIGYYAEKTDFGRNTDSDKPKKQKKSKKALKNEPVLIEENPVKELETPQTEITENVINEEIIEEPIVPKDDLLETPIEDQILIDSNKSEDENTILEENLVNNNIQELENATLNIENSNEISEIIDLKQDYESIETEISEDILGDNIILKDKQNEIIENNETTLDEENESAVKNSGIQDIINFDDIIIDDGSQNIEQDLDKQILDKTEEKPLTELDNISEEFNIEKDNDIIIDSANEKQITDEEKNNLDNLIDYETNQINDVENTEKTTDVIVEQSEINKESDLDINKNTLPTLNEEESLISEATEKIIKDEFENIDQINGIVEESEILANNDLEENSSLTEDNLAIQEEEVQEKEIIINTNNKTEKQDNEGNVSYLDSANILEDLSIENIISGAKFERTLDSSEVEIPVEDDCEDDTIINIDELNSIDKLNKSIEIAVNEEIINNFEAQEKELNQDNENTAIKKDNVKDDSMNIEEALEVKKEFNFDQIINTNEDNVNPTIEISNDNIIIDNNLSTQSDNIIEKDIEVDNPSMSIKELNNETDAISKTEDIKNFEDEDLEVNEGLDIRNDLDPILNIEERNISPTIENFDDKSNNIIERDIEVEEPNILKQEENDEINITSSIKDSTYTIEDKSEEIKNNLNIETEDSQTLEENENDAQTSETNMLNDNSMIEKGIAEIEEINIEDSTNSESHNDTLKNNIIKPALQYEEEISVLDVDNKINKQQIHNETEGTNIEENSMIDDKTILVNEESIPEITENEAKVIDDNKIEKPKKEKKSFFSFGKKKNKKETINQQENVVEPNNENVSEVKEVSSEEIIQNSSSTESDEEEELWKF